LVEGEIREVDLSGGRRRSLKVWLSDRAFGGLMLRFFHCSRQQIDALKPGVRLRCYGEVRQGPSTLEMVHADYRIQSEEPGAIEECLTPLYPSTEGLQQFSWRGLTDQALALLARQAPRECLPEEVLLPMGLPSLVEALTYLHRPPLDADPEDLIERRHPAFHRLAFDELAAHQVSLRRLRAAQRAIAAPVLAGDGSLRRQLPDALRFRMTAAQERVVAEIAADLKGERPMQRLLQGDVGAGKTLGAALAALQAIETGAQVALMAPTELLSEQHRRGFAGWLAPLDVEPLWLVGRDKGRERLGLAQLHYLRGRVGRGSVRSHCVLPFHPPLSIAARERLGVIRSAESGFEIAERDPAGHARSGGGFWVRARPAPCSSASPTPCATNIGSPPPNRPPT
jgi:ATP-dependent DNA helicase RecG